MKKLLIFLPIVIVLAVIVAVVVITNNSLKYEIEEVSEYNYFKLYKDLKYGVIDKKGNVIVNPEYELVYIPNPSKPVFVCYYDYNEETSEYKTKVFDENANEIFTQYDKVEAFVFKDTNTSKIPFEKSVLKYRENGKYGLIDFKGNKITENIYTSIENLEYKEGCFIVEDEGKFGVINLKGKQIVNIEYNKIEADGYYTKETKCYETGFIVAKKLEDGYKFGYINSNGNIVLKNEFSEIYRVNNIDDTKDVYLIAYKNGKAGLYKNDRCVINHEYEEIEFNKTSKLIAVQKASKQGVLDINGKQIVPVEYDSILFSGNNINATKNNEVTIFKSNGQKVEENDFKSTISTKNENYIITVDKNGKYGVKNKKGDIIIKNNYQFLEYAFDNFFIATYNGKVGIINDEDKYVVNFEYDIIQQIQDTNTMQAINATENTIDIYDKNAKKTISVKNGNIYIEDGFIKILSNTDRIYIDNNGAKISNKDIYKNNKIFASLKDGKWGFVDKDGKEVVEHKYDMVTEVNTMGYAGIKLNDLWGVIDQDGNIILEPTYKLGQLEPNFVNKYCGLNFGYGFEYYTDEL